MPSLNSTPRCLDPVGRPDPRGGPSHTRRYRGKRLRAGSRGGWRRAHLVPQLHSQHQGVGKQGRQLHQQAPEAAAHIRKAHRRRRPTGGGPIGSRGSSSGRASVRRGGAGEGEEGGEVGLPLDMGRAQGAATQAAGHETETASKLITTAGSGTRDWPEDAGIQIAGTVLEGGGRSDSGARRRWPPHTGKWESLRGLLWARAR
jgi:hypothetical protein